MARSPTVFSLRDVSLELGNKRALSGVSWEVKPGEHWAVIGPNGSGKTSLLSIINGYRWPSEGEATVLGRRFGEADLRELRTEIGLVSAYLDGMIPKNERVLDLVVSGKFGSVRLWERTDNTDIERASSLLTSLGCGEHAQKHMWQLSQGERQKATIARALMARPRLLTLDEPCEGLDIASRESFIGGLDALVGGRRSAGGRGDDGQTTFVEVTHRTEDIPPAFTHALLLREGRVVASGRKESALTAENVSACFGIDLDLKRWGGRYYMVARGRGR